jgi:alanine dehydrogenase
MPVRLLTRRDVAALMTPSDYLDAVTAGFAAVGEGCAASPVPLHLSVAEGGFHAKAASYRAARSYVALKFNANFANNPLRYGLPTIQGSILLHDGDDGRLLAIMDSIEVTLRRTAAATAVAARHLARPDAEVLTVCGCGAQARPQIEALLQLLPLRRVLLWDIDAAQAHRLREAMTDLPIDVGVASGLTEATRCSDAIVTCTPSHTAFLGPGALKPGCFIAAVGADSPHKSEIQPALMASSTVVVDSLAQCATMGDLHHALAAGVMSTADVHAELAELVSRIKPGRHRDDEICLFDSTGTAIQDVASAALVFERASERGVGAQLDLAAD